MKGIYEHPRGRQHIVQGSPPGDNATFPKRPATLSLLLFWRYTCAWWRFYNPFQLDLVRSVDFVRREKSKSDWYLVDVQLSKEETQRQNRFLAQAIKTNDHKLLEMSLEDGACPDADLGNGANMLVMAVEVGNDFARGRLLQAGASTDRRMESDRSPLITAIELGNDSASESFFRLGRLQTLCMKLHFLR